MKYLTTHSCVDCGEKDPLVLDFDHLDPTTKSYNVSALISANYSLEVLEQEITKCVVRCANCHRRRTAKEWGSYRLLSVATLEMVLETMLDRKQVDNAPKLNKRLAEEIRQRYKAGEGYKRLAKAYGVAKSTIIGIVKREFYK